MAKQTLADWEATHGNPFTPVPDRPPSPGFDAARKAIANGYGLRAEKVVDGGVLFRVVEKAAV
jgi:hypothetical protein